MSAGASDERGLCCSGERHPLFRHFSAAIAYYDGYLFFAVLPATTPDLGLSSDLFLEKLSTCQAY